MRLTHRFVIALGALLMLAGPVAGEEATPTTTDRTTATATDMPGVLLDASNPDTEHATTGAAERAAPAEPPAKNEEARPIVMQYFRALDQRGLNVFESPKDPGVEHTGFKIDWGAAFASQ